MSSTSRHLNARCSYRERHRVLEDDGDATVDDYYFFFVQEMSHDNHMRLKFLNVDLE